MTPEQIITSWGYAGLAACVFLLILAFMGAIGGTNTQMRKRARLEKRTFKKVVYTPDDIRALIFADVSKKNNLSDEPAAGELMRLRLKEDPDSIVSLMAEGVCSDITVRLMHWELK